MCKCGCDGACTYVPVQRAFNWSVNCIQEGMRPVLRHDLLPLEPHREACKGERLPWRGSCAEGGGDWPELAKITGLTSWNATFGCMDCMVDKPNFFNFHGISVNGLPYPLKTHVAYLDEVACNLVGVAITNRADVDRLVAGLVYNKTWPHGREVLPDTGLERFNLKPGDRLVPGETCHDLSQLESVAIPSIVFFIRPSLHSFLNGVTVLWDIPGVHGWGIRYFTAERLVGDLLHCFDLGILQRYIGLSLQRVLLANPWRIVRTEKKERLEASIVRLRLVLRKYYKRRRKAGQIAARKLSRVDKLSLAMLGTAKSPNLHVKGEETRGLLLFTVEQVKAHMPIIDRGPQLLKAGECMLKFFDVIGRASRVMTHEEQKQILDCVLDHNKWYGAAGGHYVPKHHQAVHIALRSGDFGNHRFHTAYEDQKKRLTRTSTRME